MIKVHKIIKIRDKNKISKNGNNILLFSGGTMIDIIDITVYIEIIDRRSRIKFLKRRCDRGTFLHCRCFAARYSR